MPNPTAEPNFDHYLECAACEGWAAIPPSDYDTDGRPLYLDGARGTCPECGAVSMVSVDDADGDGVTAHSVAVECRHGTAWEDTCSACVDEDAAHCANMENANA